jgi:hypothetical protein
VRKIALATVAAFGVLAAGCTSPQSHELSDLADGEVFMGADIESFVYEATGLIIFDMPDGESGWVFTNDDLPFPKATDGSDACEFPTGQKYFTDEPPTEPVPTAPWTHWLRITNTGEGFAVQFDNDKTVYTARMDDPTSTTEYRFWRGMPYSFRPCPPWAK